MRPTRSAFTLVELSIVLVILGLLVGGVLAGQSLIRSAELRNIGKEKDQITTAFNAFRDKYFALPADMPNAFAFWSGSGVSGCTINSTIRDGGCNGDGSGIITSGGTADESVEYLKAFMHFSLAGLVEGNYNGMDEEPFDFNSYKSRFPQSLWVFDTRDPAGGLPTSGVYIALIGLDGPVLSLTHSEAWNLDTKMDDGKANTGAMRGDDDADCYDQDTDGNPANGDEDVYGLIAVGGDYAGDCTLNFIVRK